jgi:hypothetical protein
MEGHIPMITPFVREQAVYRLLRTTGSNDACALIKREINKTGAGKRVASNNKQGAHF